MTDDGICSYPRCRDVTSLVLYTHGLCEKHWEMQCEQFQNLAPGALTTKLEQEICSADELTAIETGRKTPYAPSESRKIIDAYRAKTQEVKKDDAGGLKFGHWKIPN